MSCNEQQHQPVFDVPDGKSIFDMPPATAESATSTTTEEVPAMRKMSSLLTHLTRVNQALQASNAEIGVDPRDMLDMILGPIRDDDLLSEFTTYGDAIASACDVFSPSEQQCFNVIDCRREQRFLENCDVQVRRRIPTAKVLIENSGTRMRYMRTRTLAKVLTTVHILKTLFTKNWRTVMGDKETVVCRLNDAYYRSVNVKSAHEMAVQGDFDHWSSLVYELLSLLSYSDLRFTASMRFTEMLLNAEYHMLRPAIDAMCSQTLFVCLFSPHYFCEVWSAYMRHYYPRIFKEHDDKDDEEYTKYVQSTVEPRWRNLQFYRPIDEISDQYATEEFAEFIVGFFNSTFTRRFLRSFKRIDAPREFDYIVERVFKVRHNDDDNDETAVLDSGRPKRRCVRPPIILQGAQTRRRTN